MQPYAYIPSEIVELPNVYNLVSKLALDHKIDNIPIHFTGVMSTIY